MCQSAYNLLNLICVIDLRYTCEIDHVSRGHLISSLSSRCLGVPSKMQGHERFIYTAKVCPSVCCLSLPHMREFSALCCGQHNLRSNVLRIKLELFW